MVDYGQPLPVSVCGRALSIPTNMFGGPIRFRLLVDVDESWAAAELGPHDRRQATPPLRSEGTPYGLMEFDGSSVILAELLAEGDYHTVLLRAGIDETQRDGLFDDSDERYGLLLQPVSSPQVAGALACGQACPRRAASGVCGVSSVKRWLSGARSRSANPTSVFGKL